MLKSTLAIVERDGLEWAIEDHDDEIRITCAEILTARLLLIGGLVGPIEPEPEWAHPALRMEALRHDVIATLADRARWGEGPWAVMGSHA